MGENAQVRYSEVCVISEKDQMMKTKHGGIKYVRYSEGYTIVHVCDTEVKLYCFWENIGIHEEVENIRRALQNCNFKLFDCMVKFSYPVK